MQQWPDFLPCFQGSPTESIKSNLAVTGGDGRKVQKQRYRTGLVTVPVTVNFTNKTLPIFEYFHRVKLHSGADWFLAKYYIQGSLPTDAIMRIVSGKYKLSASGAGNWSASMKVEVKY